MPAATCTSNFSVKKRICRALSGSEILNNGKQQQKNENEKHHYLYSVLRVLSQMRPFTFFIVPRALILLDNVKRSITCHN